ncbi:bifunctional DNA-binding transcriptional regulator/O6-methylguanine-DNA methyltransferase Ada [Methylobacterium gossipiicola]|uniref:methylated-DNA--[protein]-cysteine S-methyltransferase n=1 Tax=Methylobacterium gossipiicola TaxID=582675 RepID=A0A1I2W051_9HYPH|nr:bifunctional DNA-binding transcriptional regulator/O6-methylguanine-DNA methyltransferase Ada [Methylobacterium gossipiicola]SFG93967.1 AraC family transcriptional regulator, regulatory protein of adaptative response / methylated-DNA-[protein]-cysteine methyltransferase [Methylobacterium gossipiicola]
MSSPLPAAAPDLPDADARWAAVVARDPAADGCFVYAVRTTGVYCRPGCGARTPRRENVSFHATPAAAREAGFRPCLRCRPDDPPRSARHAEAVARACRLITAAEEPPALAALARVAGLSPFHFHRVFRELTGVTPKAYAEAVRTERLAAALPEAATVTEAAYAAGYGTAGRFYAAAEQRLGMAPGAARRGGAGIAIRYCVAACSLGSVLVAATERGLCAILLGDDPEALVHDLRVRFPKADLAEAEAGFAARVAEVVAFVEAPRLGLALPLDIGGTAFQQRVWAALRAIPPGRTATYAEIAGRIGQPAAVRAVARACAANAHAVAIPCHRVVREDGSRAGYRWGVARKAELLRREKPGPGDLE